MIITQMKTFFTFRRNLTEDSPDDDDDRDLDDDYIEDEDYVN